MVQVELVRRVRAVQVDGIESRQVPETWRTRSWPARAQHRDVAPPEPTELPRRFDEGLADLRVAPDVRQQLAGRDVAAVLGLADLQQ